MARIEAAAAAAIVCRLANWLFVGFYWEADPAHVQVENLLKSNWFVWKVIQFLARHKFFLCLFLWIPIFFDSIIAFAHLNIITKPIKDLFCTHTYFTILDLKMVWAGVENFARICSKFTIYGYYLPFRFNESFWFKCV